MLTWYEYLILRCGNYPSDNDVLLRDISINSHVLTLLHQITNMSIEEKLNVVVPQVP